MILPRTTSFFFCCLFFFSSFFFFLCVCVCLLGMQCGDSVRGTKRWIIHLTQLRNNAHLATKRDSLSCSVGYCTPSCATLGRFYTVSITSRSKFFFLYKKEKEKDNDLKRAQHGLVGAVLRYSNCGLCAVTTKCSKTGFQSMQRWDAVHVLPR